MNKLITLLSLFLFLGIQNTSTAQVKEEIKYMSDGEHNAFTFVIETDDDRNIEKLWKKYFKEYGKMKKDRKEDEWYSKEKVYIPTNGSVSYDIVFKLVEKGDVLHAYLWAKDDTQYVSSDATPNEAKKIKRMFEDFAHQSEVYVIESLLEDEEDALKKLEKTLSKLESKNSKYHKNIEAAKDKIIKNEQDIENNIEDQKKINEDIDEQQKRIQKVKEHLNSL